MTRPNNGGVVTSFTHDVSSNSQVPLDYAVTKGTEIKVEFVSVLNNDDNYYVRLQLHACYKQTSEYRIISVVYAPAYYLQPKPLLQPLLQLLYHQLLLAPLQVKVCLTEITYVIYLAS